MAKRFNLNEELNRINAIIENSQKINEGLYLDDRYTPDMDDTFQENPEAEEMPQDEERLSEKYAVLDQIRELALKGLTELSKEPDSEQYQSLKKIFLMLDKKPSKTEGEQKTV